jgi:polysaccharide pyruvyl transferase WcaK-like protein
MSKKRLLLLGSYGRGNIGDDAFLVAAQTLLQEFDLIINSADDHLIPEYIRSSVIARIPTDSIGSVLQTLWHLVHAHGIVYGGGDLWVELEGDRFPRLSLWKMLLLNTAARSFRKKVVYLGCGAGNLDGFSLRLARASARLATHIVARDQKTIEILQAKNAQALADLTVNLFERGSKKSLPASPATIGISVMYYIPSPGDTFNPYILRIAEFISDVCKSSDIKFKLFPLYLSGDPHNDLWASQQLLQHIHPKYRQRVELVIPKDLDHFFDELRNIDLMIGTRLHSNILSILTGIPSIGLAYRPKVQRFFEAIGLQQYCIPIEKLELLQDAFNRMQQHYTVEAQAFRTARDTLFESKKAYEDVVRSYL